MSYEKMRIRKVYNHYGARDTGGTQGVNPDVGAFSINVDGSRLPFIFPVTKEAGVLITGIVKAQATGNITKLTIGGVDVSGATESAPVKLPKDNTGVVVLEGPTAGTVLVKYIRFMG